MTSNERTATRIALPRRTARCLAIPRLHYTTAQRITQRALQGLNVTSLPSTTKQRDDGTMHKRATPAVPNDALRERDTPNRDEKSLACNT